MLQKLTLVFKSPGEVLEDKTVGAMGDLTTEVREDSYVSTAECQGWCDHISQCVCFGQRRTTNLQARHHFCGLGLRLGHQAKIAKL
jgi:hypothetical protein